MQVFNMQLPSSQLCSAYNMIILNIVLTVVFF